MTSPMTPIREIPFEIPKIWPRQLPQLSLPRLGSQPRNIIESQFKKEARKKRKYTNPDPVEIQLNLARLSQSRSRSLREIEEPLIFSSRDLGPDRKFWRRKSLEPIDVRNLSRSLKIHYVSAAKLLNWSCIAPAPVVPSEESLSFSDSDSSNDKVSTEPIEETILLPNTHPIPHTRLLEHFVPLSTFVIKASIEEYLENLQQNEVLEKPTEMVVEALDHVQNLPDRFSLDEIEPPHLLISPPKMRHISIQLSVPRSQWRLETSSFKSRLEKFVQDDIAYLDPCMNPVPEPTLLMNVSWILESLPARAAARPPLTLLKPELIGIGLPNWDANVLGQKFSSPTTTDWRPRWPVPSSKRMPNSDAKSDVQILGKRTLDVFGTDGDTRYHFECSIVNVALLSDLVWSMSLTSPLDDYSAHLRHSSFPDSRSGVLKKSRIKNFEDLDSALHSVGYIKPINQELVDKSCLFISLYCEEDWARFYESIIISCDSHVVLASDSLETASLISSRIGFTSEKDFASVPVSKLLELRLPETSSILIVDHSCTNHSLFRSSSWTKEEVLCRTFFQSRRDRISRVVLCCSQPPSSRNIMQAILETFSITEVRVDCLDRRRLVATVGADVHHSTRDVLKALIKLASPNVSVSENKIVDFIFEEVKRSKEALAEAVFQDKSALKMATARSAVYTICRSLLIGGANSARSSLQGVQSKLKGIPPSESFFDSISGAINSVTSTESTLIDTVKAVISKSYVGLMTDLEDLKVEVICSSDLEKRLVASLANLGGHVTIYTLAEAPSRVESPNLSVLLDIPDSIAPNNLSTTCVRVSTVSQALQVAQQDESAKVALMKRLCRGKPSTLISANEALSRMEHPTISPKWTANLKVFWNARDRLSSQSQAVFKLKQYCKLTLIERALKRDETIVVDPNSCITVAAISSIADGSFALHNDNGVSLLERYSRVCLVVLDDGIRRAVPFADIIEKFVGPIKKGNGATQFSWIPIRLETDLAPAVCQVCNSFSPAKPELMDVWAAREWITSNISPGETALSQCAYLNPFFTNLILQRQPSIAALKAMRREDRRRSLAFLPSHILDGLENFLEHYVYSA